MRSTELETLLADYPEVSKFKTFIHKKSVDSAENLPDGTDGDIRKTLDDSHYHLYDNGWQDLGSLDDERIEEMKTDIDSLKLSTGTPVDLSNYIKKDEVDDVILDATDEIFIPMTDEDIDQILGGA